MDSRNNNYAPNGMPSGPYYASSTSDYGLLDFNDYATSAQQPTPTPPAQSMTHYQPFSDPAPNFDPTLSQDFGLQSQYPSQEIDYSSQHFFNPLPAYPSSAFQSLPVAATISRPSHPPPPDYPRFFGLGDGMSFQGAGANSSMYLSNTYGQPTFAATVPQPELEMIENLFGNSSPRAIVINGSPGAIAKLREAVITESAMIDGKAQSCQEAFITSLQLLQAKGAIADHEMGRFALDEMPWQDRAALGITQDDFNIDPKDSVQYATTPPFQGNIDSLLGLLRVMAKYHGFQPGTGYQLGIVTKSGLDDYVVHLLKAQKETEPLHTVWMYRDCTAGERWYAFVQGLGATAANSRGIQDVFQFQVRQQKSANFDEDYDIASTKASSKSKRKQSRATTKRPQKFASRASVPRSQSVPAVYPKPSAPSMSAASPVAPTALVYHHPIPPRHRWRGARHAQDNEHEFQHLSDEEILSGWVHPEDICGTLMLRLVPNYSNTELHQRIMELYREVNPAKPKEISPNAVTKRWTLPLQHICDRDGLDYETEKAKYFALRRANGIIGGDNEKPPGRGKASKAKAGQKTAAVKYEDFDEDADAEAELESDDGEAPVALAPVVSTRGKRTRKQVDYAAFGEPFGDLEDEEARPAKRTKKYAEDDDDESSDFEED